MDQLHLDIWYRPLGPAGPRVWVHLVWGVGVGGDIRGPARLHTSQVCPLPPRDHDDDVSLVEACRKLNEVIGLKGMSRYDGGTLVSPRHRACSLATWASRWWLPRDHRWKPTASPRYFKQIVKSARANGTAGSTDDHTDDFLGCLNIPIRVSGGQGCSHRALTLRGCPWWLGPVPQASAILPGPGGAVCSGVREGPASWGLLCPGTPPPRPTADCVLRAGWEAEVCVVSLVPQRVWGGKDCQCEHPPLRRCRWRVKTAGSSWNPAPALPGCRETASWSSS